MKTTSRERAAIAHGARVFALETIDACLAGRLNRMAAEKKLDALHIRGTFTYDEPSRFIGYDYDAQAWIERSAAS